MAVSFFTLAQMNDKVDIYVVERQKSGMKEVHPIIIQIFCLPTCGQEPCGNLRFRTANIYLRG